ncbi:Uncharacterised protein [Mycoplasmoides pneumoniae]|uniref:DUF3899 domain-containing protein n=1 Tax=Mycoplasmoides pneumoniae TaxID=2104 RepID=A0AB38W885_MYCPM|nr:Uncharacterised protein [Mycoplasmoides pneumoniae]
MVQNILQKNDTSKYMLGTQTTNSKPREYGGLIVSTIYIVLFFAILNLTVFFNKTNNINLILKNSCVVSFVVVWLLVCLQGIVRLKTCDGARYEISKFNQYLKLGSIYAKPNISFDEYKAKSSSYRKQTRGFWWMNFSLYLLGSLISIVVSLL